MVPTCLPRKAISLGFERLDAHCRTQAFRLSRKELHLGLRGCRIFSPSKLQHAFSRPASTDDSVSTPAASSPNGQVPSATNTVTLEAPSNSDKTNMGPPPSPSEAPSPPTASSAPADSSSSSGPAGSSGSTLSSNVTPEILPPEEEEPKFGLNSGVLATVGFAGGLIALVGVGTVFREPIKAFLEFFVFAVDQWGPLGYVAYGVVYTGLEVLAVPAIPLTMTAGVIFGPTTGTIIVSLSATTAATIAFLIARYVARERVMEFAKKNPKFAAIDRAIGKDSLKVVTLLRLSPLLPLAISNYLYGLTSVDLASYVLGSFVGMLPGTYAYVSAGHLGKAVLTEGEGMLSVEAWQVGVGITASVLAIAFIGRLAKEALDDAAPGADSE